MPDIIKSSGEPIENLAQEVRESLQLGPPLLQANAEANRNPIFKMKTIRKHRRNCPYGAPPSSRANCDSRNSPKSQLRKWNHQRRRYPSTCLPGTTLYWVYWKRKLISSNFQLNFGLVLINVHVDVFMKLYFNQMKSVLCSAMKLFRETNLHRNPPILRKK